MPADDLDGYDMGELRQLFEDAGCVEGLALLDDLAGLAARVENGLPRPPAIVGIACALMRHGCDYRETRSALMFIAGMQKARLAAGLE